MASSGCNSDDVNRKRIGLGDEIPGQALPRKMATGHCGVKSSSWMSSLYPVYCSHTSLMCKNKHWISFKGNWLYMKVRLSLT